MRKSWRQVVDMGQTKRMECDVDGVRTELGAFKYLVVVSSGVASSTGNRAVPFGLGVPACWVKVQVSR